MKCPKCGFSQDRESTECPKCGIIFEKYAARQKILSEDAKITIDQQENGHPASSLIRFFLHVKPDTNPIFLGGRAILLLILVIWSWKLIQSPIASNYAGKCLLHLVNLPFHEFGHIIFRPFGRIITSLGGTLGQLLMPLVCLAVFLLKTRDTFAASIALWWFGENFIDIAPYINDARALRLPLLGGNTGRSAPYGFHDWEFILKELGLQRYDHTFAPISHVTGSILMIWALCWASYLLFKQFKNINTVKNRPDP